MPAVAKKPVVEKPATAAKKPATAAKKPATAAKKPATAAKKPDAVVKQLMTSQKLQQKAAGYMLAAANASSRGM